ncbi:MAG: Gfo/Idh/MocA family oxidoreductase [Campylobacter sp.]|nr:Gfo/Idh/MocA family oxidoreductase [Campylobacter sp.]
MRDKIALIGLDSKTKKHFSELRRSDYFELVGIYDKNTKNEDFGRFEFFSDIDLMFSQAKPVAAIVKADQNSKEIITKTLKYVRNIFIETPCFLSLDELKDLAQIASNNASKIAVGFNARFNPTIISLIREFKKESEIFDMNFISGSSKDSGDLASDLLLKDIDLVRFLLGSEIMDFALKSLQKDIIHSNLQTKSKVLINIASNTLYPIKRERIEISTSSGFYLADLTNFTLHKITKNGRLNLKVDNEDFSIRNEHKQFFEVCKSGEFNELASIDDLIKAKETLI